MERAARVLGQILSSDWIFPAAKNGGSRRDFLPWSSRYRAKNLWFQPSGALLEFAVPLEVFRIVPL